MIIATLLIAAVVQVTDAPFAMPPIPEAVIPAKDFRITDYGAKPDGSNCRAAFAASVKACVAAGGERVVEPRGRWTSGAIALASNCALHLGKVRKDPFVVRQAEDIRCENVRYRDATGREGRADAARGYLDLVETAVGAYDATRLESYTREAETLGVREHGFPRLAANLAQLVAAGRLAEKKPLLARMMTAACASAKKGKMPPKSGGNEFSVRELVMAVVALEKARSFPPETIAAWKADLSSVDAYVCYTTAKIPLGQPVGKNWPLFGAASEQARLHYGLGGDPKFVETWVSDQLRHFDQNGMYRDPHEPSVYDFVGRICFMAILHFGYDGPCRTQVEEKLLLSAEPTLAMLSVAGEMPYGGRSNQFLHNNTLYAGVAEWYAAFFAKRGDAARAARFRASAARAVEALEPWLKGDKVFHVKNRYPRPETKDARYLDQKWFGCENYAYFDKYMITMGSWAVLAREFAGEDRCLRSTMDDPSSQSNNQTIKQSNNSIIQPSTLNLQPSTFVTSEPFHWKFTNSRNYTVQEDWRANPQYDATGIGRIHRRGAPPAICLSAPFAAEPHYFIGGGKNPGPLAIAAEGGKMTYEVSDTGVEIRVSGENGRLTLPVFEFDGAEATRIEIAEHLVKVSYCGWVCRYETSDGTFADTGLKYHNRNGRYRRIDCTGRDFLVRVTIEREEGLTGTWASLLDPPSGYISFQRTVTPVEKFSCDGFDVELCRQANGPGTFQRVMIAVPRGLKGKAPCVIAPFYFPEAMLGFDPASGTNLAAYAGITYMSDLARRGYVTISADAYYRTYATRNAPDGDAAKWRHVGETLGRDWPTWSGCGKLVFDTRLLVDLAAADPRVDASRIGMIGHSLGGKMAYLAGLTDPRVKVVVASDFGLGWTQTNWDDVWYWGAKLETLRAQGLSNVDLLAQSGGKPFCLIAGCYDDADSGRLLKSAAGYATHPENLLFIHHGKGHRPPRDATERGYRFLDGVLKDAR